MDIRTVILIMLATHSSIPGATSLDNESQGSNQALSAGKQCCKRRGECRDDGSVLNGDPSKQCCGKQEFDPSLQSCCVDRLHEGAGLSCCNTTAYSPTNSSCCQGNLTSGVSELVSDCCQSVPFYPLTEICCVGRIHPRDLHSKCCGPEVHNEKTQLCCRNTTILEKKSEHDVCCGSNSYNKETHCCTPTDLRTLPRNDTRCNFTKNDINVSPAPQRKRCCMNKMTNKCQHYGANQTCCEGSISDTPGTGWLEGRCCGPKGYNPENQICCEGRVFPRKQDETQCCGVEPYSVAKHGTLCCNGILYRDVGEEEECVGSTLYSPAQETKCGSAVHCVVGQHCCGHETYNPDKHLCCAGKRHKRSSRKTMCCGVQAYNPKNQKLKCCSGHLYSLTHLSTNTSHSECCGTHLIANTSLETCCTSAQMQVLYQTQPNFSCCGHLYYNTSQHRCCAGNVRPLSKQRGTRGPQRNGHSGDCQLLHFANLMISEFCNTTVFMGTVDSVAVRGTSRSVLLKNVLQIQGAKNVTAEPAARLLPLDHCSCPR